jgi:acylpyruvate hydrolase
MKLVTFLREGKARLGALATINGTESVVDLNRADSKIPATMLEFLDAGESAMKLAQQALGKPPAEAVSARSVVKLLAPIPRPGKIICIGLNYRDHAAETGQQPPAYPTVFAKYSTCVIAPDEPIVLPRVSKEVDYEAELAFVIGKKARNVSKADAMKYVAGYLPFNDVSARDYQRRTSQWTMGKTPDTFGPMGPALVTADEVPDPHTLDIQLSINGEVLQKSNTRDSIFSVEALIEDLSAVMTLEPGDLISTGTPSGVGQARNPKRFLKPGDVVSIEIARLGLSCQTLSSRNP